MNGHSIVVVADGGEAHIFRVDGARLLEMGHLERPSAHLPARDLVTDRTGRVFDSGSRVGRGPKTRARHGAQSDYDPHEVEVERFAKQLALWLDDERSKKSFDRAVLIAEPRFLGVLRPQLSAQMHQLIEREIAKDLVQSDSATIRRVAFPPRSVL